MNQCQWVKPDGFHTCGSSAMSIDPEGDLCDVHYWQAIAEQLTEAPIAVKRTICTPVYPDEIRADAQADAAIAAFHTAKGA